MIARREFITLLGGAWASCGSWPPAAHAQGALPVIGLLHPGSPEANARYVAGFRKGLAETGLVEGAMFRSNIAGDTASPPGCRSWRPSW
jgi:putative ABC transport system substrate-binding protein